jgi:hypothetical protein
MSLPREEEGCAQREKDTGLSNIRIGSPAASVKSGIIATLRSAA